MDEFVKRLKNKLLSDMQEDMEDEIDKPYGKCDYDTVTELSDMIYHIRYGENADISEKTAAAKDELIVALRNM